MRAVGFFSFGGPEVLEVIEVPEVTTGPGQLRIKVHAACVNPTDIMSRDGSNSERLKTLPPPYVPGMDIAGIIDQVGDGVTTGIKVGDSVIAMVVSMGAHGGYREQIVLEQNSVVKAPVGIDHIEACTLPMNGLTALQSLDLLGLSEGQSLAVTGSPGAYGGYLIQLAKALGLTVIADASKSDEKLVRSLGADFIIQRGGNYPKLIRDYFPSGVDGLADGALLNERAIPAVRDSGNFTSVRGFVGEPQRNIRFTTTSVRSYDGEFQRLDSLRQMVEEGIITLRVAATYPPEKASEAHRRLSSGGTRGRLVIQFF